MSTANPPGRTRYLGIDVSKVRLDVCLLPEGEAFSVPNDQAGIDELLARLGRERPEVVVLEATGGYERPAAAAIAACGIAVAVVNPRQARDFARPPGAWPRPTRSTPRFSPASLRPWARGRASSPTRRCALCRRSSSAGVSF